MNIGNENDRQKNEAGMVSSVIIFRTFDLGEFFKKKNESDIHFLDNRTNSNFQKLFRYKPEEQTNECSNVYLQDLFPETDDTLPFRFSKNDNELDEKAYRTGMVRSNLYDLCIFPKYECNTKVCKTLINLLFNVSKAEDELMPRDEIDGKLEAELNEILEKRNKLRLGCLNEENKSNEKKKLKDKLIKYKKQLLEWRNSLSFYARDNFFIKLSISQYGVISVFLELELNKDGEFNQIHSTSLSDKLEKSKEKLKKLYYLDDSQNGPSLITFISIIAIFDFLYAIRDINNYYHPNLNNWFRNIGDIICFDELWKSCTSKNKLPLRHNLSYFYFQDHRYDRSRLTENADFRKKLNELALFTSYQYSDNDVFDADIERYKKNELCVTTNGTAQMIDTTLIVAASYADYRVGGQQIMEGDYWKGIFRLICFLREYLLLCDRCLKVLRQLRDDYNSARRPKNQIKNDLSSVSNLLFDMDEGINRILSSRILFTHDKLKAISINSGLLDLMDNVTRRRRHLENRINEASIHKSQKTALRTSNIAIMVSILAAFISLYFSVYLSNQEDKAENTNFDRLMQAIGEPKSGDQQSTNPDSATSLLKDIKCKLTKHSDQDESCLKKR